MYKLVLVEFPYTEKLGKKKRPALLITDGVYGRHKIAIVAYITSRHGEGIESEVEINELQKKSVIKLHKLVNVTESTIKGEIGELSQEKTLEVEKKLKKLLQLH